MNMLCVLFLSLGYYNIKMKNKESHKKFMISALAASAIFFISYLVYHYNVGTYKFGGQGGVRKVYFTILLTHTVLSIIMLPMIFVTLYHAIRGNFEKHPVIARWTLPIWIYVSFTGVIIYFMLYHMYPPAG